ncbi:hypothetical protein [Spirosoma validum]|uniref:Uncharacterized protein n=1 Tax=Spirosoma validum TaxID=2771355 RepID=A0A927GDP6_9BACT|nr:hypothetical protein [Spirosoma validum]MBD2753791.1 hypothetical protein [Spirosoma validum]
MGAFGIKKTLINRGVAIWQKLWETAQSGFVLDATNLVADSVIPAGSVIGYDELTRKAVVLKAATLQANVTNTATDYPVLKGHLFKVGDFLAAAKGSKAYAITAINTSNAAFDTLTIGTTLGSALSTGAALFQSGTTGASNSSFITQPKGLLYTDVTVVPNADLAVILRGTVYARRIPAVSDEIKAALPLIIFSQSY